MPEKKCGDCGLSVHVRRRECDCGYVFPMAKKSKRKARDTQVDPNTVDYVFDGWKKVPARTRLQKCGTCSKKMKGGMIAWHSSYTDGEKYWWCESCLKDFKDETFYKLSQTN